MFSWWYMNTCVYELGYELNAWNFQRLLLHCFTLTVSKSIQVVLLFVHYTERSSFLLLIQSILCENGSLWHIHNNAMTFMHVCVSSWLWTNIDALLYIHFLLQEEINSPFHNNQLHVLLLYTFNWCMRIFNARYEFTL